MTKEIGFIGLGVMGFHMASHLLKQKKTIHIIDRESLNTKKFIKRYRNTGLLKSYKNLYELAKNVHLIVSCVGNDKDLKNVYLSKNGILAGIKPKTSIVDHTTASPEISKYLHKQFLKKQSFFFDAPMSGGEIGAKEGKLSLMVGGDKDKISLISPTLQIYSKSLIYMGKSGNGQITKMVNQICVASVIQGLSEALFFAKKKQINIDKLIQVLKNGAAQSWQLENRAKTMWNNEFNFGFMNKLMLKDLNLIFEEVGKGGKINLTVTKLIKNKYKRLVKLGYEKEDTSNLIRLLK